MTRRLKSQKKSSKKDLKTSFWRYGFCYIGLIWKGERGEVTEFAYCLYLQNSLNLF